MRTRGSLDDKTDGGDLESWISGLTDGETSARRLRKRIGSAGTAECQACEQAATGELHHDHGDGSGRLTA